MQIDNKGAITLTLLWIGLLFILIGAFFLGKYYIKEDEALFLKGIILLLLSNILCWTGIWITRKRTAEYRFFLYEYIYTFIVLEVLITIGHFHEKIISSLNVWGTIALAIFFGVILFIIRERKRFTYGSTEFFIGVFSIICAFRPENFDMHKIKFDLDFNMKLAGGLYIMVRGQDNIVKALKGSKTGDWLAKLGIGK